MRHAILLATLLLAAAWAGPASAVTVITPPTGEKAYQIAGEAFAEMWQKVTGQAAVLRMADAGRRDLPEGPVVLIGSDAVQPAVHQMIRSGVIDGLGLAYGNDNYRLLSLERDGRPVLIVAGGSGRSTIYAAYDFFRRRAGAEYFWDGDVIPHRASIDLAGLDVLEKPRFQYRGLRYFAHRGLHRFQAEHWDLDDWKHEIDWLMKKRFNLFMLRTGIDDLFQRAFPGEVPYPPTDGVDPDAQLRSYNDRTSFWPLKYRGELRKAVLQYARDRGLLHPEDCGTITHWYSHTPSSFYASHPNFPVIRDQKTGYTLGTHAIWDIEHEITWDSYWRLTDTHIREYGGGSPRLFHTIGMAERTFGSSERDNLQRKLYVYRKTQQKLRERSPDAPLLIASWDFLWWADKDVCDLMDQFDPRRTIVLEYTADSANKVTYRDWGIIGRFPWIFGIFHSFARNSDIHEDYGMLRGRLAEAAADPHCTGMVMWTEISHSDTFLLEYLGDNSWQPDRLEASQAADRFCRTRYPAELGAAMRPVWGDLLELSQTANWTSRGSTRSIVFAEPQFRLLTSWSPTPAALEVVNTEYDRIRGPLAASPAVLERLARLAPRWYADELWRRDALDIARTVANRALFVSLALGARKFEAWRAGQADADAVRSVAQTSRALMAALGDVLAQSDDFSMDASLHRLQRARPLGGVAPTLNPHSEQTLKGNAENDYCRSHMVELVRGAYQPEFAAYWDAIEQRLAANDRSPWRRTAELSAQSKAIDDAFYAKPLAELAPAPARGDKPLAQALGTLNAQVRKLVEPEAKH